MDDLRREANDLENNLIDELNEGRLTRAQFLQRGAVIGLSLTFMSAILAACGSSESTSSDESSAGIPTATTIRGGTLVVAVELPNEALDPVTSQSNPAKSLFSQVGDFLAWSGSDLVLKPRVATSWKPNGDGTVWTFQIREDVTFHDGTQLTAEDVAATFNRLADPATQSNALSVFAGYLSPGGVTAVDARTVRFELDRAFSRFPNLVSSDNYNAIIQPKTRPAKWEKTFNGSGPWRVKSYASHSGALLIRNDEYWDQSRVPLLDAQELKFYDSMQARIVALQGGEAHFIAAFPVTEGEALLTDPNINILEIETSRYPEIHMRVDRPPFKDRRVREAMALLVDRQALTEGLLQNHGAIGNDVPIAPIYGLLPEGQNQRERNVDRAKQLLVDAGMEGGFSVSLYAPQYQELPDLAVVLQDQLREAGITIRPQVVEEVTYYDKYWLDSSFGITGYVHRGVPNQVLTATLLSNGPWNATGLKSPKLDELIYSLNAELDIQRQRALAIEIRDELHAETPMLVPYFNNSLAAVRSEITGSIETTGAFLYDIVGAGLNQ